MKKKHQENKLRVKYRERDFPGKECRHCINFESSHTAAQAIEFRNKFTKALSKTACGYVSGTYWRSGISLILKVD